MTTANILLADQQAIFRAGVVRVLSYHPDVVIAGQCDREEELIPLIQRTSGCVLLAATALLTNLEEVLAAAGTQNTRVVLLTERQEDPPPSILRRTEGFLSRHVSADDLLRCLRRVAAGERAPAPTPPADDDAGRRIRDSLSARELQIVGYIVQGWKNRQIADEIGTKEQVVKNYLRSIYDKTGASDRLELALFTLHHRVLADAAARTTWPAATPSR